MKRVICFVKAKFLPFIILCLICSYDISATEYIHMGETKTFYVPDVARGYVDYVQWGCDVGAIEFVSKSTYSATIKLRNNYTGYATVQLVYVAKYADNDGRTRADTYYKEFSIFCVGEAENESKGLPTSIIIEPTYKVANNSKFQLKYEFYPKNTYAELHINGSGFSAMHYTDQQYFEIGVGQAGRYSGSIYFYDENDNKVSTDFEIEVYDPSWTKPEEIQLKEAILLEEGTQENILPTLVPSTATTLYYWSTDNAKVATINNGMVNAKSPGIAEITLTTFEGVRKQCSVLVVAKSDYEKGMKSAFANLITILNNIKNECIK